MTLTSCTKDPIEYNSIVPKISKLNSSTSNPRLDSIPNYYARISFFAKTDLNEGRLFVTFYNQTKTITSYYPSGIYCGSGEASFDVPCYNDSTSYYLNVKTENSPNTTVWSGNFKVYKKKCSIVELTD